MPYSVITYIQAVFFLQNIPFVSCSFAVNISRSVKRDRMNRKRCVLNGDGLCKCLLWNK